MFSLNTLVQYMCSNGDTVLLCTLLSLHHMGMGSSPKNCIINFLGADLGGAFSAVRAQCNYLGV